MTRRVFLLFVPSLRGVSQTEIVLLFIRALNNKIFLMPQLIPFYFLNQLSFAFLTLIGLVYVFSKYILPLATYQQVIRMYITKLGNK